MAAARAMSILPNIHYLGAVATTMESAVQHLQAQGEVKPFAVVAESQSTGKGSTNRSWSSPKGNLYMTLAVPQNDSRYLNPATVPVLSLLCGLVCRRAMCQVLPHRQALAQLELKWPNDILCQEKKVSGSIIESEGGYFLLGIGVNVDVAPEVTDAGRPATTLNALAAELGLPPVTTTALAEAIWENFFDMAVKATTTKESVINDFDRLMCRSATLHRRLPSGRDPEPLKPVSLDRFGRLIAKRADGKEEVLNAAEYFF